MDSRPTGLVLVLVGTRPEAIKMAPVIQALRRRQDRIEDPGSTRRGKRRLGVELALTGQHTELVGQALETFGLVPDHDLAIMREGQTLYDLAHGCLDGLRKLLEARRPALVLVQGDTASVFFGALVGYFQGVAVGHVEAGLRSGNLRSPFPEEGFRRLTGVLAELHFAPTPGARENLLREGVPEDRIHVTGNPVVDAVVEVERSATRVHEPHLRRLLDRSRNGGGPFALLTAHRRESFGQPLERVFRAVLELLRAEPELECIFPVHPNPRVMEPAARILGDEPRIHLVSPLGYGELVQALAGAALVLTDSGGIQEEAPSFGTPVLVLREVTERPEGIQAGVARLVGTDPGRILEEARAILAEDPKARDRRRQANPYGDGQAGERIAGVVERFLEEQGKGRGEG